MSRDLRRLIGIVDALIAGLPKIDQGRIESYAERRRAALGALSVLERTEGARWGVSGDTTTLTLGRLRASTTRGACAVLTNWRAAAQKRIGGAT